MGRTEKQKQRLETIVESAGEVFRKYGFTRSTLSDVARAAGMAKATLYHYVGSKEELIRLVISGHLDQYLHGIADIVSSDLDAGSKMEAYAGHLLRYHQQVLFRYREHQQDLHQQIPKHIGLLRTMRARELEMVARILRQGCADGVFHVDSVESAASLLAHGFRGMLAQVLEEPGEDPEQLVRDFLSVLFHGLLRRSNGASVTAESNDV